MSLASCGSLNRTFVGAFQRSFHEPWFIPPCESDFARHSLVRDIADEFLPRDAAPCGQVRREATEPVPALVVLARH
jgi:hypothetical protein